MSPKLPWLNTSSGMRSSCVFMSVGIGKSPFLPSALP
jgi:hypothetical protein